MAKPINRHDLYSVIAKYLDSSEIREKRIIMLTSDLLREEPDLIDLVDKFMRRLPVLQGSINSAHTEKNTKEFSDLIHQLKGVGGGYGYPMLTELCAKIEFKVASDDTDNINSLMKEFNQMIEQILAGNEENHKIAEQAQS